MAGRRGRGLDPATKLHISLTGEAVRLVRDRVPHDEAVERLRPLVVSGPAVAGDVVGHLVGGYLAAPTTHTAETLKAAALLLEAGADPAAVTVAADRTRKNASGSAYSTPV